MTAYIIRRLLHGVLIVFIVSVLVFLIMRMLPGDPVLLYLTDSEV